MGSLARGVEPPKAMAGETVTFTDHGHEWEDTILAPCDVNYPNSGHWYCATHRQGTDPNWPSSTEHGEWRRTGPGLMRFGHERWLRGLVR